MTAINTSESDRDTLQGTAAALVNMPFALADRPSIQCGLLKGALTARGCAAEVYYLNLELAARLGDAAYRPLSLLRANLLVGEWLFAVAAFGEIMNEREGGTALLPLIEFCEESGFDFADLQRLRLEVLPAWVDHWASAIDWSRYTIVGFSSTFEQNNASFALARAIKATAPQVPIIFGGANFDGEMGAEFIRALPFIDYVVVGEADVVLPELVGRISRGEPVGSLPGVIEKNSAIALPSRAPGVVDMNELPDPDYDEYFATLQRLGDGTKLTSWRTPLILIESARGCWWGQKHHCTFCGLNANGMAFRSKSPAAAVAQLRRLSNRYGTTNFEAVDNILDYRYLESVCIPLAKERLDYRLFYEVKANLKREQLGNMARAGIKTIQPGIESMSSHLLALMRKGTTMLQNVRCLKWATFYGIRVTWNILTGFPGEREEDYRDQARLLPLLVHLAPPSNCGRIWLERFSPYFFDADFPVKNKRPLEAYRLIYPYEQIDISKVAYFFDYDMEDTVDSSILLDLQAAAKRWRESWAHLQRPQLAYKRAPDWLRILDRRGPKEVTATFGAIEARVYEACSDAERTLPQLLQSLGDTADGGVPAAAVSDALHRFCDAGYMIEEDAKFLSLALPINPNWW